MLRGIKIDFWTLWGFVAQGIFLSSFVIQWWKSEKKKESYLPVEFWYLRILGAGMLLLYVIVREDVVFMVALVLQIMIYIRNIFLKKENN
jgi:lipid-A-disaccharide synthase-like uncharacterized protein